MALVTTHYRHLRIGVLKQPNLPNSTHITFLNRNSIPHFLPKHSLYQGVHEKLHIIDDY